MSGVNVKARGRVLLGGKVIFNFGQSSINCMVRRIADDGATIEVESGLGVPDAFQLSVASEGLLEPCKLVWRSEKQIGVTFERPATVAPGSSEERSRQGGPEQTLRAHTLALRAALDEAPLGIVLLDAQLNARFINRAFRRMWALPDDKADRHPSFAALMFHGRDTGAYEVSAEQLDGYIAGRIEQIQKDPTFVIDLRRHKGDVVRMQCTPVADGGRMLTYTEVTDIVRQSDELKLLRDALENVQDGVLLLDANLHATFMNRKVRQFWGISDQEAASRPLYGSLITRAHRAVDPNGSAKEAAGFAARRIAEVEGGDHERELQTPDGRRLRAHCTTSASGGRMITYFDITDLIKNAEQLEILATSDPLTGLSNRRHFLGALDAEWSRFQRYYRSLSLLMIDIDHFKNINDSYGHALGDEAIKSVAEACLQGKRKADIVGRIGGEEFAVLLPETSLTRARIVAERIRKRIAAQVLQAGHAHIKITASIGMAEASAGMSDSASLLAAADQALYQAKAEGRNRCSPSSGLPPQHLGVGPSGGGAGE